MSIPIPRHAQSTIKYSTEGALVHETNGHGPSAGNREFNMVQTVVPWLPFAPSISGAHGCRRVTDPARKPPLRVTNLASRKTKTFRLNICWQGLKSETLHTREALAFERLYVAHSIRCMRCVGRWLAGTVCDSAVGNIVNPKQR